MSQLRCRHPSLLEWLPSSLSTLFDHLRSSPIILAQPGMSFYHYPYKMDVGLAS